MARSSLPTTASYRNTIDYFNTDIFFRSAKKNSHGNTTPRSGGNATPRSNSTTPRGSRAAAATATSTLHRSDGVERKQEIYRARYWAHLFANLRQTVDLIYATCQSDSSVVECKVGAAAG